MLKKFKHFLSSCKGNFQQLGDTAMQVVIFGIVIALGALVLSTVRAMPQVLLRVNSTGGIVVGTAAGNANATLAIDRSLSGLSDLSSWTGILVIVIVFAVILAMIYGFYRSRND